MATKILLPRLGESVEEAAIGRWCKEVGEPVARGEVIAELETAKAMMELESPVKGVLLAVFPEIGVTIQMGELVAVVGKPDEDWEAELKKESEDQEKEKKNTQLAAAKVDSAVQFPKTSDEERRRISPSAKRLAKELGVDLDKIPLEGENSRITSEMVQKYAESEKKNDSSIPGRRIPLNKIKSITAQRMSQSTRDIPQFSVSMEISADRLVKFVQAQKKSSGNQITVTAVLIWKVAEALAKHPEFNACYEAESDSMLAFEPINIAVATAAPEGLYVPVIHSVNEMELKDIAARLGNLAERTRSGKLRLEDSAEATFTISNLGMKGVKSFTPIINPGQAAILGVGAIRKELSIDLDGNPVPQKVFTLTVTADHRIVDGMAVADFLGTLKNLLENL